MQVNTRDAAAGVIFIVFGGLFVLGALGLERGTAFRMGPGFFPLVLAGLLIALGLAVIIKSVGSMSPAMSAVPWRALALVLSAPVIFGLTVRGLGLLPAVAAVVLISAFASQRVSVRLALILMAGLTGFCVLVFGVGLKLPIPLFGPWLAD